MKSNNIKKIITLLDSKQYEIAEKEIDLLLIKNGTDDDYLFLKGQISFMLNKTEESWEILINILKKYPENFNALSFFYKLCIAKRLSGVASACLSKLINIKPDRIDFYKEKIRILEFFLKENNKKTIIPNHQSNDIHAYEMNDIEVLILCGGEASRWKSYLGSKHKHLINIEGEVLLQRTLNQVLNYPVSKVTVLIKKGDTDVFKKVCGHKVNLVEINQPEDIETPAWKYLSSKPFWNKNGLTVSLLGDVWFSDLAIKKIFSHDVNDWIAFGRLGKSQFTGCPYGEIFAHKFFNIEKHLAALNLLDDLYKIKLCNHGASGWALSQMICNQDPNYQTATTNFVHIDDFTEDFDFQEDYERWIGARKQLI